MRLLPACPQVIFIIISWGLVAVIVAWTRAVVRDGLRRNSGGVALKPSPPDLRVNYLVT
jgi:hypothetical protein